MTGRERDEMDWLRLSSLLVLYLPRPSLHGQERISFPVGASTKTAGYTPLWAGVKQGFFAQQGLDVQPVVIRGSDRVIQALVGGSVYASVLAPDAPLVAADRGLDAVHRGGQHAAVGALDTWRQKLPNL